MPTITIALKRAADLTSGDTIKVDGTWRHVYGHLTGGARAPHQNDPLVQLAEAIAADDLDDRWVVMTIDDDPKVRLVEASLGLGNGQRTRKRLMALTSDSQPVTVGEYDDRVLVARGIDLFEVQIEVPDTSDEEGN